MPETEAEFYPERGFKSSCTVVIGEAVLFFGGMLQTRQMSQLTPSGIIRIGTLPFTFHSGSCLAMENRLFLGFPAYHGNTSWSR